MSDIFPIRSIDSRLNKLLSQFEAVEKIVRILIGHGTAL